MRIAFRATEGGGELDEVVQVAWGDGYTTFFGVGSGAHGRQPQANLTFSRPFTGWNCIESGRVEGREIRLHLHDARSAIDHHGPVVVRRCHLDRGLLFIDIEPLNLGREMLEGFDVELHLDWKSWDSLCWGARELFKGAEDLLHIEEVEVAEGGERADRAEANPVARPESHDPWTDDAGDIPF